MKPVALLLFLLTVFHQIGFGLEKDSSLISRGSVQLKLNAFMGGNIILHGQRNFNKKHSVYLRAGGHFKDLYVIKWIAGARHGNSNGILSGIGNRIHDAKSGLFIGSEFQANFFWFSRARYEDKDYGFDQFETYDIIYKEHGDYQTVSLLLTMGYDHRKKVPFVFSFGAGPRWMRIHGRNAIHQVGYETIVVPHRIISYFKLTWDLTLSLGFPL